jgi:putative hydrolase of the HAD superfamily
MEFDVVCFDLDGTLYPYAPCNAAGKRAAWEAAVDLGYDLDREDFESLYQTGRRETKRELAGTASAHERFLYFKRAIRIHAATHRPAHALELGEAYWSAYVAEMTAVDGLETVLDAFASRGVDVAIVTNLTTRIQLEKIEELGIEQSVDLLVTSEETGREKPASVMFTLPLAQLDAKPSRAAFVGDDPSSDVEGGNAVGLETVLVDPDGEHTDLDGQMQPDHHVEAFADVLEVLG